MNSTFVVKKENQGQDMIMMDTYSHGFDMPASVQLQRVNRKINCWDRTQELIEKNKAIDQQRAKSIIVKEEKI